jgi:type IV secretory pathway VirJ component
VTHRRVHTIGRCALLVAVLVVSEHAMAPAQSTMRAVAPPFPILEVPADSGRTVALLLTGDGGWADGDRALAHGLARDGIAVVGLDTRAYLRGAPRTPESTARDAQGILERYSSAWHRDRLALIGYSRGADLAPFVVSRLPVALRRRLALVTLIGFADRASFEFHWKDVVYQARRPTDLPTRPELERIRGTPILCVYGQGEKDSLCPALDRSLARVVQHSGGHVLDRTSGTAVAALIASALR